MSRASRSNAAFRQLRHGRYLVQPYGLKPSPLPRFQHTQKTLQEDFAQFLGPREIYDTAYKRDKVLSVPFEEVLALVESVSLSGHENIPDGLKSFNMNSDDLLIVSKIIRRAPSLKDGRMARSRHKLARDLCYASAIMDNQGAALFWAEETLSKTEYSPADRTKAMAMLTKLAEEKVGKANYILADQLYSLKQESAAMKAYRLAGEQGIAKSYTKLGRILRLKGHTQNAQEAFKLAADAGDPNAQFLMATETTDSQEKLQYLQKAASGGNIEAAHSLGEHYRIAGQTELAKEYYGMAAQKGLQPSQVNLAIILSNQKKFDEAEKWYLQAAKAGGEIGNHASKALQDMKKSDAYKNRGLCSIM